MKFNISFFSLLAFGIILTSISCEQDTIATIETQTPVVEAYIFAGQAVDSIRITQSIAYSSDGILVTLDDLVINISDEEQTVGLVPIGNGYYQNLNFIIRENTSYELQFSVDGELSSSNTYVPLQRTASLSHDEINMEQVDGFGFGTANQDLEPIEINWDNSESDYYYVLVENVDENPEYINLFLQELFENEEEGLPRLSFVTEPQIVNNYSIDTRREIQQFGLHRVIVYRVNSEYAALYESASNSSLTLSEPPSNIENGLGIFTGVSADTLFFEVKKI